MKKVFALCIGALLLCSCEKSESPEIDPVVISFENVTLDSEGIFYGTDTGEDWGDFYKKYACNYEGLTFITGVAEWGWVASVVSGNASTDDTAIGWMYGSHVYGNGGAENTGKFLAVFDGSYGDEISRSCVYFGAGVEHNIQKLFITNSSPAYWAVKDGKDGFSNNTIFEDGDYFGVTITGYDKSGVITGSVDFVLADYRSGKTFICTDWKAVALSSLGKVNKLTFHVFGSNEMTPGYFCIDQIYYQPE